MRSFRGLSISSRLSAALLFSIVASVGSLHAQQQALGGRLTWVSPPLGGEYFLTIGRSANGAIEVLTEWGVLRSTDNGASWRRESRDSASIAFSSQAQFLDDTHGWLSRGRLGYSQTADSMRDVLYTGDGGRTWSVRGRLPAGSGYFRAVVFADTLHGWAIGDGRNFARSTDGGYTWEALPAITQGYVYFSPIIPLSREHIIIPSPINSAILRTTNAGASWDTLDIIEPADGGKPAINVVVFPDSSTGYLFTSVGQVYRSTDAGASWTRKPTGLQDKLADPISGFRGEPPVRAAYFLDAMTGWVRTEYDEIIRTDDGGDTWEYLDSGKAGATYDGRTNLLSPELEDGLVIDSLTVLLIGAGGQLLRTTDGGETWSEMNASITDERLNAIAFGTSINGWIGGSRGVVLTTSDGGGTWRPQASGVDGNILDVAAVGSRHAWLALDSSVVRTTDGGATWTTTEIADFPTQRGMYRDELGVLRSRLVAIRAIEFVDERSGWIVGADGAVFRTVDGGDSWTNVTPAITGDIVLNAVEFLDPRNGWNAGDGIGAFRTSDGGDTWTRASNGLNAVGVMSLSFRDSLDGIAGLRGGNLYVTSDGGTSWHRRTPASTEWMNGALLSVSQPAPGIIWGVGTQDVNGGAGFVTRSTDGGESWAPPILLSGVSHGYFNDLAFSSPSTGLFVGPRGMIVRYDADPAGAVPIADADKLAVRLWPNPVRASRTWLRISPSSHVSISVTLFDAAGAEIPRARMTVPVESPGTSLDVEVRLDGLAAGAYRFRIEQGGRVVTCPLYLYR